VKRQGAKTVERIDIFVLAERGNFVCHICSGLVDMSVSRVSRFGATVDHVVPISKGGLDSLENVRLAHWICNIRKSDSLEFVNG
jgi:5-methylcytosine-specific restriction endonuclease McrA